ncbi:MULTISPECIES: hypothetical protein [Rhizobium]|nr:MULTISPECIES: hypothetical protein [Rhizobium]
MNGAGGFTGQRFETVQGDDAHGGAAFQVLVKSRNVAMFMIVC